LTAHAGKELSRIFGGILDVFLLTSLEQEKLSLDNKSAKASGVVLVENEITRITEWNFPKCGDNTGWHEHECDYSVIPMFSGILKIDDGTTISESSVEIGKPYFRKKGARHDVINGNDFPCSFIEIEYL
jgi:hypothetical protein